MQPGTSLCEPLGWVHKHDIDNTGTCANTGGLVFPCHVLREDSSGLCLTASNKAIKAARSGMRPTAPAPSPGDENFATEAIISTAAAAPAAAALDLEQCTPLNNRQQFLLDPITNQVCEHE
jgi:hypothetical protein